MMMKNSKYWSHPLGNGCDKNDKCSRNKNRKPRTKQDNMNNIDSELATNGYTMEFSKQEDSQSLSQPRAREETRRLQRSLQNVKGLLTREVNQCNDKIAHFKLKFADDYTTVTVVKIGYAQSIINNHNRCSTRFLNLERALEKLRELECNTWVWSDEELDTVLEKLNQDLI